MLGGKKTVNRDTELFLKSHILLGIVYLSHIRVFGADQYVCDSFPNRTSFDLIEFVVFILSFWYISNGQKNHTQRNREGERNSQEFYRFR